MMKTLSPHQHAALATLLQRLAQSTISLELTERFTTSGHCLYVVGGAVRDALLCRVGSEVGGGDLDLTTDAPPEVVLSLIRRDNWAHEVWTQGERFGTIGATRNGQRIEITTFRAEAYDPGSRNPQVRFGSSIEEDLGRRDFAMNAMAVRLPDGELIDPFGGLEDLATARLRTPGSAVQSFDDDPLRMMRVARFVAQLGVRPVEDVVEALRLRAPRLQIVARERVRDELNKLLLAPDPAAGLQLLVRTGLADSFLPELPALALEQDPVHRHKDVLAHTIAVVERAAALDTDRPDLVLRLAALLHDIGKPRTRRVDSSGVSFHHHEVVGARMAEHRLRELRYPSHMTAEISELIALHLRFHTYRMGWTDSAVRRYVRDAGAQVERLNRLVRSDCTTRNAAKARELSGYMDSLEERLVQMRASEELASIRPPLDGLQVMAILGLGPGPLVGKALHHLLELRLDRGPMSVEEATEELKRWAAEQGVDVKESSPAEGLENTPAETGAIPLEGKPMT